MLVDLVTEKRLDLPSYIVAAATVGEDGYVYAILLSTEKSSYPYVLVQIDPKNMELKQQVETTVRQSEWSGPKLISLVATPAGDIFFYATLWSQVELPDVYVHTNVHLQLAPVGLRVHASRGARGPGAVSHVGVDGRIYFYVGPAESTVSAYDPSTGELSLDIRRGAPA